MNTNELPNAGDLAVVIRYPHPCVNKIGFHFVVGAVRRGEVVCETCGRNLTAGAYAWTETVIGVPLEWCRRVPPLAELESIDVVSEIERESKRPREWVTA